MKANMKAAWTCVLFLVAAMSTGGAYANAQAITYQGVLSDGAAAHSGTAQLSLSLWDAASGGAQVWGPESHGSVAVVNGSFAVLLGSVTPFGAVFENNSNLWLQVSADVGGGLQTFTPRVAFAAAPYALMAQRAASAATADSATTADTATTALSANTATTADSATTADHATTADSATTATTATTALSANTATTADSATTATTANTALSANTATTADSATTATTANTALSADSVDWSGIQNVPGDLADGGNAATLNGLPSGAFSLTGHTHVASEITGGVFDFLRLPVGTGANQVAQGNHTHAASAITSGTMDMARLPVGTGANQVAQGDHRHTNLPYFVGQVGGELSGIKSIGTQEASGITNDGSGLIAPIAGRYFVQFQQLTQTGVGHNYLGITLNGGFLVYGYMPGGHFRDMVVSRLVTMNAGDVIRFQTLGEPQANAWGGIHSSVSMYLTH